jgi:DNA polymerase elongation subunit (family B)
MRDSPAPEILLFDIENCPSLGWYYDLYKEGNIVGTKSNWYMLSFAYKWLGEKTVHTHALPDFKGYKRNKEDDEALVTKLHEIMSQADIIIGHNVDRFDIRKANARFIKHGLPPVKPYKTVDTLKIAKRVGYFDSNRLDALGQYLGVGRKLPHTGFDLWRGCMSGDMKSWAIMRKYNAQDVTLLEKVYLKLRPWGPHPNVNIVNQQTNACPKCGSKMLQKRGFKYTRTSEAQQYFCLSCHAWPTGKPEPLPVKVHIR